jgi:hypothetical protein
MGCYSVRRSSVSNDGRPSLNAPLSPPAIAVHSRCCRAGEASWPGGRAPGPGSGAPSPIASWPGRRHMAARAPPTAARAGCYHRTSHMCSGRRRGGGGHRRRPPRRGQRPVGDRVGAPGGHWPAAATLATRDTGDTYPAPGRHTASPHSPHTRPGGPLGLTGQG